MSYVLIQRLRSVQDEYDASRGLLAFAERRWTVLGGGAELTGIDLASIRNSRGGLDATYLIRLFAEFEGCLLTHLSSAHPRRRIPRTAEALINRVALLNHVADGARDRAHEIRLYRNSIVHPGAPVAAIADFEGALGALNRFLSHLPTTT
jgi:hypothetical protein